MARRRREVTGGDSRRRDSPPDLPADADPAAVARNIALRQLTMAPRTRAQLAEAMKRRGVPPEVAESVLERFEEVNLVDDEAFAQQWVQSRHLGRGLAARALAHELRQRGVADETVKQAVGDIGPEEELAAARDLVRRRLASGREEDPIRRQRRIAGALARKGYGSQTAMRAIREVIGELSEDPADGSDL